jgi:putative ABC transport system permease protein
MLPFRIRPGIRRLLRLPDRPERVRHDVDEEIRTHLELHAAWLVERGVPLDDARNAAEREFGALGQAREQLVRLARQRTERSRSRVWWEGLRQDVRLAIRGARRNPGVTLTAVTVLGLGIGLNAAVFSVFDSVILRPLPYRDPSRLVVVWRTPKTRQDLVAASFDTYRDAVQWSAEHHGFAELATATWALGPRVYQPAVGPARWVLAIPASINLFDVLGVHPSVGRTFRRDDLGRSCTTVLSHAFWQQAAGADTSVVGRSLTIDGRPCVIVGVMPASFEFYPRATELWTLISPLTDTTLARHASDYIVGVFARLRPGVTRESAQRELRAIQQRSPGPTSLERDFVPTVYDLQVEFTWLAGRNLHTTLIVLLVAVGLVLVVACLNVAHLLIGRAAVREREFAVRVALGSGHARLTRQLLAESGLLAAGGVTLGLAIAVFATRYIDSASFVELPPGAEAHLDLTVIAALATMGTIATLIVGALPAWRIAGLSTADALKASGRATARRGWLPVTLVVSEVTLSVTLLVAAGLLIRSLQQLRATPLGYNGHGLLSMRVALPTDDSTRLRRFQTDVIERARTVPGVAGDALASRLPIEGSGEVYSVGVSGRDDLTDATSGAGLAIVSPSYFDIMGVPLITGRGLDATDRPGSAPVAVVNRAFVRRYLAAADPIGQRIRLGADTIAVPWLTIVGIVGDEQRSTVTREMGWISAPMVFRAVAQVPPAASMQLIVRSIENPSALASGVSAALRAADGDVIVSDVAPMSVLLDRFLLSPRTRAQLLTWLAALAFTLSVVGLYGLLSQLVVQRTREIGIRVALGAPRAEVVAMIVRRAMMLTASGVALGWLLALVAGRAMRALLYGIEPFDPTMLVVGSVVFVATSAAASVIPARRAVALDPVVALRTE